MVEAQRTSLQSLVVSLDSASFYLWTEQIDPDRMLEVMEHDQGGIAQLGGALLVYSPHQNNLEMQFAVEMWSGEPPSDLDDWEEAFQAHMVIGEAGLTYDSPNCVPVPIDVPSGRYRLLITGRGFVAHGWPGSTTPGDVWRLRLWPDSDPIAPGRLLEWHEPAVKHPEPRFAEAGIAAVRRLHNALDDLPELSGKRGTATAIRRMPGSRRKLFRYFEDFSGWLTSTSGGGRSGTFSIHGPLHGDTEWEDANRIVACDGDIKCVQVESLPPQHVVLTWTWHRRPRELATQSSLEMTVLVPEPPQMTLRVDLSNAPKDGDTPTTIVQITHSDVPTEWVDDLAAYWHWALERADYDFDLSDARRAGYTN